MSMHKREAKRYVRAAMVSAVGLSGCAVLLWAKDIPGVNKPIGHAEPAAAPEPTQAPAPVQAARLETLDRDTAEGMAQRLDLATKHTPKTPDPIPGPTPPPAPPGLDWRYVGPIFDGASIRAIVTVNNRQRVLREGAEVDKATLERVTPEMILVKDAAGAPHEIYRKEGDGVRVAWLHNMPSNRAVATAAAGAPGAPGTAIANVATPGGNGVDSRLNSRRRG